MAILNKRSVSTGSRPNLVSGELAHNIADDVLFFRSGGWLTPLDLEQLRNLAPPASGIEGAPLASYGAGVQFDAGQAPASTVAGRIRVDAPTPADVWAIAGETILGPGPDVAFKTAVARVERFYVASDRIRIQELLVRPTQASAGLIRLGVVDGSNGSLRWSTQITPITDANQVFSVGATLARGWHEIVLWSDVPVLMKTALTSAIDRGFDIVSNAMSYETDIWEAPADFTAGIDRAGISPAPVLASTPATSKMALIRWTEA